MSNIESILRRVYGNESPEKEDLESLLSLRNEKDQEALFSFADNVRRDFCGDGIILRGIVEFSNHCRKDCLYCGLNKNNKSLERYRFDSGQVRKAVSLVADGGIKTVVLQSGEDDFLDAAWLRDVIEEIKAEFGVAVTLSVGERRAGDYRLWKEAGADRYLLKIETSDRELYESLHPGMSFENRLACLRTLRDMGYQTGSGSIVGLKGQSLSHIAEDILFFYREGFDMIGIGPFIPHGQTALKAQEPGSVFLTLRTLAITRIVCRDIHLPATTALGSMGQDFRRDALMCGANVLMPNFTPKPYRKLYEIYPGKRCVDEPVGACSRCMEAMAGSLGRFIDDSVGDSLKSRRHECRVNKYVNSPTTNKGEVETCLKKY